MYKLFISPHLDDIIFSLGNYINSISKKSNIIIATVFTKENKEKLKNMKGELFTYGNYQKRIEEDKNAMKKLDNVKVIYFNLEDEIFRENVSNIKLELEISYNINKILKKYEIKDIYLPLGIGYHNDHILVNNSIYHLNLHDYNINYYYDYPYCNNELNLISRLSDYGIFKEKLNLKMIKNYYNDPIYSSLNFFVKTIKVSYLVIRYSFNFIFRQFKNQYEITNYRIDSNLKLNLMKNYDSQIIPIFGNLDNLKRLLKINDNEKILKFKKYKMIDYNIIKYLFVSPLLLFNLTNYIIRIFCFIFILKAIFFKNKIKLNKRKRDIEFYILIPIYNEEKNLEKLIKNLVIHDKINYIMINDCSSDKSLNVLNKYKKEYNFKIINRICKRGFVSGVLNDSIKFINKTKKSSGTYIGVVNADSYLKKETIKNIYSFLSEYDLDILNFKNVPILNNNNFINTIESFEKNFKNKLSENIEVSLNNGYLIKYKYLNLVNFWNEKEITEDLNLTIKLKQLNCNFYQSNFKIYDNLPKNIISLFNQKYRWIKGDLKNRIRYYPRDFFELIVNIYYLFPLYFLIYLFLNLFIIFDFNKIIITQFIISFVEISLYFIFTNTFNLNLIFYAIYQLSLKLFFYIRYFINFLEDDKWY